MFHRRSRPLESWSPPKLILRCLASLRQRGWASVDVRARVGDETTLQTDVTCSNPRQPAAATYKKGYGDGRVVARGNKADEENRRWQAQEEQSERRAPAEAATGRIG